MTEPSPKVKLLELLYQGIVSGETAKTPAEKLQARNRAAAARGTPQTARQARHRAALKFLFGSRRRQKELRPAPGRVCAAQRTECPAMIQRAAPEPDTYMAFKER